ncbi:MAG: hypothetical protein Q8O28_10750 [Smithellaceae bacterium]|nr:hypothetical protein [Smithellaceae bacterium]
MVKLVRQGKKNAFPTPRHDPKNKTGGMRLLHPKHECIDQYSNGYQ